MSRGRAGRGEQGRAPKSRSPSCAIGEEPLCAPIQRREAREGNEQGRGGNSPWRTAGEQHRRGGASRRGAEDGQRRQGGDPGGGGAAPAWRSEAA